MIIWIYDIPIPVSFEQYCYLINNNLTDYSNTLNVHVNNGKDYFLVLFVIQHRY